MSPAGDKGCRLQGTTLVQIWAVFRVVCEGASKGFKSSSQANDDRHIRRTTVVVQLRGFWTVCFDSDVNPRLQLPKHIRIRWPSGALERGFACVSVCSIPGSLNKTLQEGFALPSGRVGSYPPGGFSSMGGTTPSKCDPPLWHLRVLHTQNISLNNGAKTTPRVDFFDAKT